MANFQFNDGGRQASGYKGTTRDCVCRAIAIATKAQYQDVYDALSMMITLDHIKNKKNLTKKKKTARSGVPKKIYHEFLTKIGWTWVPCVKVGVGCKVHLRESELPKGRLIVRVSKHLTTVIDGVINDTWDCSRNGTRCVYGYFIKE